MSIKEKYTVSSIESYLTYDWVLNKHYAKRIPSISYSFGLYVENYLVGILTIGKPASNNLCEGICGKHNSKYVYELNRLCVNDGLERNVLSFFVSSCLRLIKEDLILVSYADTMMDHVGYIYQACSFLYTGATLERTDQFSGENKHSRHAKNKNERKIRSSKHRYVYFLGKMRLKFKKDLKYKILSYPKGEIKRYDTSYTPSIQTKLF